MNKIRTFSSKIKSTIEIDCEPFSPRPNTYMEYICENILHCEYYNPISKFFGNWTWDVEYDSKDQQKEVADYLIDLYNKDRIRYASW